jgi:hypothetical protein
MRSIEAHKNIKRLTKRIESESKTKLLAEIGLKKS